MNGRPDTGNGEARVARIRLLRGSVWGSPVPPAPPHFVEGGRALQLGPSAPARSPCGLFLAAVEKGPAGPS
ncbi:UNVERIFIED_CONTAM: hypothetical protein K2H54_040358 [Gekko kuhli]